jgi:hypothetical protein
VGTASRNDYKNLGTEVLAANHDAQFIFAGRADRQAPEGRYTVDGLCSQHAAANEVTPRPRTDPDQSHAHRQMAPPAAELIQHGDADRIQSAASNIAGRLRQELDRDRPRLSD